jgi:hypothetical protein
MSDDVTKGGPSSTGGGFLSGPNAPGDPSRLVTREIYFYRPVPLRAQLASAIRFGFFGLVLVLGGVLLLLWNETRLDTIDLAQAAVPVDPSGATAAADGALVSVTGPLATTENVGDGLFLKPDHYLAVHRTVAMYSWVEEQTSQTQKVMNGVSQTTTTTRYRLAWAHPPEDSSQFKDPAGHRNPPPALADGVYRAQTGAVGAYTLDLGKLTLPAELPLSPNAQNTTLSGGAVLADQQSIFDGKGSPVAPQLGDLRIQYAVVPSGLQVTAFGRLQGHALVPYADASGQQFYAIYAGSRADALAAYQSARTESVWVFRLVGFLVVFVGMWIVCAPLLTLLEAVPFIGNVPSMIVGGFSAAAALGLTYATIVAATTFHREIAPVVALAEVVASHPGLLIGLAIILALVLLWSWRGRPAPQRAPARARHAR